MTGRYGARTMRVHQLPARLAHLPVKAVVDVAGRNIVVHPSLDHAAAVAEISALLPGVHPDAVEHWVETVLPTAEPLWKVVRGR